MVLGGLALEIHGVIKEILPKVHICERAAEGTEGEEKEERCSVSHLLVLQEHKTHFDGCLGALTQLWQNDPARRIAAVCVCKLVTLQEEFNKKVLIYNGGASDVSPTVEVQDGGQVAKQKVLLAYQTLGQFTDIVHCSHVML